jgi:hypothetical protein
MVSQSLGRFLHHELARSLVDDAQLNGFSGVTDDGAALEGIYASW